MEIFIGFLGFMVAAWQLHLQRNEIRKNGRINTLIHMSSLIKDRIDLHSKIIEDQKKIGKAWQGHAKVINDELRPLLAQINKDLIEATSEYRCSFDHLEVAKALKLQEQPESAC